MAYTVSFDANGGTGAPSPQTSSETYGNVLIPSTIPTRNGYTFLYWTDKKDGTGDRYRPNFSYTFPGSVTVYAQWVSNTCRIDYNMNGGSNIPDMLNSGNYGAVINLTDGVPTKEGYTFLGWATSKAKADKGIVEYASEAVYRFHKNRAVLWAVWLSDEWKKADAYYKA